ncbi:MAG: hypothetical protein ACHQCF_00255 [Solirubrobacterales bacterium]
MGLPPVANAVDDGSVLALITVIVAPIAAVAFARSGGLWREIGRGPFAIDQDLPPRNPGGSLSTPVDPAIQAAEARQMIEAKSYRRQRQGGPPLDVEAEVRELLEHAATPTLDQELRQEVRRLVVASNERRRRRGEAELDVEAETERQLSEIS